MSSIEVKVLERSENSLKLEVFGEGHTLLNLLQKALLADDRVEMAGYHIPHRLIGGSIFYVRTKEGTSPIDAILDASERLKKEVGEFEEAFSKALRECGRRGP